MPNRRRDFPLSVLAPPSLPLSFTPLLVEASLGEVAQLERDALGREGAWVDDGLGVAHDGFGLGLKLEPKPKPMLKMELWGLPIGGRYWA